MRESRGHGDVSVGGLRTRGDGGVGGLSEEEGGGGRVGEVGDGGEGSSADTTTTSRDERARQLQFTELATMSFPLPSNSRAKNENEGGRRKAQSSTHLPS